MHLQEILTVTSPEELELAVREAGLEPAVCQALLDRLEHFQLESRELVPSVPEQLDPKQAY